MNQPIGFNPVSRLTSLDALRGLSMVWIVGLGTIIKALCDTASSLPLHGVSAQLEHGMNGRFTFLDLIFPLFIFIAGMAQWLSLSRRITASGKKSFIGHILRRGILLFGIGVLYSNGIVHSLCDLRLLGILQRIAICSTVTGVLVVYAKPKTVALVAAGLLLGYWALMALVPVPGVGAGSFVEGRNLAHYFDSLFLPLRKFNGTYDPEGILSTLPAIAGCILGVLAGMVLTTSKLSEQSRVVVLFIIGLLCCLVGYSWGLTFPIMKSIWSSSYVMVTTGYSCMLTAGFYQIIEIWKIRKWSLPLVWIGTNPITMFLLYRILLSRHTLARFMPGNAFSNVQYSIVLNSVAFAIVLVCAGAMYYRRIHIRL